MYMYSSLSEYDNQSLTLNRSRGIDLSQETLSSRNLNKITENCKYTTPFYRLYYILFIV